MADDFPVVISAAGPIPTPPATLLAALIASVASSNPGYTANLPGTLIEDVASTEVGGLAEIDSARVETINSLTPYGANAFMLAQLGQIYIGQGSAPGIPTNTSVFVQFTAVDAGSNPLPGQVIPVGFVVSDGTFQYVVQDGGVTASDGTSDPLFCLANQSGEWSVPTNTVTQIVTSAPSDVVLTCSNPTPGISGEAAETEEENRARVLQAGQAVSTGTTTLLKTLLEQVSGVQKRLISTRQQAGAWEVIVGGGDPYLVAGAINASGINITTLVGSTLSITGITKANPGVITTDINHGYSTGQSAEASGIVGMTPLNGVPFTVTVINEKSFSIGIDTLGYPNYVSGGVLSPNLRNITVNINDQPDIYSVTFVNPPQQTVAVAATYNTTQANFVSQASVSQLAIPAIVDYINSIVVGQPISLLVLSEVFTAAIATVLNASLLSALAFSISINGIPTMPTGELVFGDLESYMSTTSASVSVTQS